MIELVGRADNQIKLRGFRIELGEIETALLKIAGIRQAVVNVYESQVGEKRLAAYVVAEPMAWSADAVRAQLASTLPDYMVPTALMCLAALPVTSNGKIDRKALPAPTIAAEQAFVAPATACELWLADVWSSLLKPGRPVSAADNFFALGGHSLLAMRVIAKVRQERQAALPITAVFEAQTLAALALRIEQAGPAEAQPIVHRGPGRAP
ncbi:phosphopantetheine-binding protein, partial [Janthinobacterium sp. BJB426]|uniref:phosphopantetheine-binding protein n=1 Tax=Janthinobacterium sp. BJB426 TaxID=2048010 RepID=UPI001F257426